MALIIITGTDSSETLGGGVSYLDQVSINGLGGDDELSGGSNSDTLIGGDGNDTLSGYGGGDWLEGGNGNDTYWVYPFEVGATLVEQPGGGFDVIESDVSWVLADGFEGLHLYDSTPGVVTGTGNDGDNEIFGFGIIGESTFLLQGLGGNDTLAGGYNADTLDGGDGNDTLYARSGHLVIGGAGNDVFVLDAATGATLEEHAGGGIDTIQTHFSFTLPEHFENLVIEASSSFDTFSGTGNDADNRISFGPSGSGHHYNFSGAGGDDTLLGGYLPDTLSGGGGHDQLSGGGSNDALLGGNGNDGLWGGAGLDTLGGGNGNDSLGGGAGNDVINGDAGSDELYGGDDNDSLQGGDGNDSLWGDAGNDTLDGGDGDDYLDGKAGNNLLRGNVGADQLVGGGDSDRLVGGMGDDTLTGGGGTDVFLFQASLATSADTITDFQGGTDKLHVAKWLTNLSQTGSLWAERLTMGTAATEVDDRFVFDAATGNLYYDEDGNGAGTQMLMATLTGVTTLSASDIVIV